MTSHHAADWNLFRRPALDALMAAHVRLRAMRRDFLYGRWGE